MKAAAITTANAGKALNDPLSLWKFRSRKTVHSGDGPQCIPVSEWISHFENQSKKPNSRVESVFDAQLSELLVSKPRPNGVVVTPSGIKAIVHKLVKKVFCGSGQYMCTAPYGRE